MTRIALNRPSTLIRLAIAAGLPAEAMPDLSQPEPKPFTDADREAIERAQQKRARKAARRLAVPDPEKKALKEFRKLFGDSFTDLVRSIQLRASRSDAAQTLTRSIHAKVDEAIDAINQAFATAHFEAIQEAHEDFLEIVATPEFQCWLEAMEQDRRTSVDRILPNGTARQIIATLNEFKNETGKEEAQ